jgi:hypothetical protein
MRDIKGIYTIYITPNIVILGADLPGQGGDADLMRDIDGRTGVIMGCK